MKIVESFPHAVVDIENLWIPMPDGRRLAARLWLPEGAERAPVPAIVEYIPYRKRDRTRLRDEPMHRYFAGHGYAALRIDLRGAGESEGLLRDEYLEQEQDDGVQALRFIAAQPWCSGAIGMIGKSWGGFNALQVAARRPPELKAIITVCSTDDRYADDAHYMGGCLLNENLIWGTVLFTINAQPPDPELVGEGWRDIWMERLRSNPLFPEIWLRHQRRDDYWKHGSVCEDYAAIACPVLAVGGWADAYSNAVPRLLAGLQAPRRGLVGPWAHLYPHQGVPRPAIGFLQEALKWWDRWLKGTDSGIDGDPIYRAWMQESVPPRSYYDERPGRWVAETSWPSPRIRPRRFILNAGRLDDYIDPERPVTLCSPQTVGLAAGSWCGFGAEGEMPLDQRDDASGSLLFDSEPLPERMEILGAPVVTLSIAVDRPQAFVAVRLNDVAPDGASTRVSYGLLNLTHRDGHEHPAALRPGERFEAVVRLNDVAHAFPPGHRLRIALSTCYWPVVWPSPEPVTLTVQAGAGALELPVRPPRPGDERLRPFGPPEAAPPPETTALHQPESRRSVSRDAATGVTTVTIERDVDEEGGPALTLVESIDLAIGHSIVERYSIKDDDPLSAQAVIEHRAITRRGAWSIRIETCARLSATATAFRLQAELRAYEDDREVFARDWDTTIPRDQV